jgi:hypothetical protein
MTIPVTWGAEWLDAVLQFGQLLQHWGWQHIRPGSSTTQHSITQHRCNIVSTTSLMVVMVHCVTNVSCCSN